MKALAITEEALAVAELDEELDHALTLNLLESVSNWCSWPETPPEVVAAIEAHMGPMSRLRWNSIRDQGLSVAEWIRDGGAPDRTGETPARYRQVEDADLRFLIRSNTQYVDETMAVGVADRVLFEKATGRGV